MAYGRYRTSRYRGASRSRSSYYTPISKATALRQQASIEAMKFVRQAFFSLDFARLERYFNLYAREHGSSAGAYARRTYPKWRSKEVGMSGETATRLLKIVPGILSRQDQLRLLEIYIPFLQQSLAETFRESLGNQVIPALELATFYERAEAMAQKIALPLDWFVKGVFTEDELAHFQEIIRFLLIGRLQASFKNVVSDLIALHNACREKPIEISLSYQIAALGAQVDIETAQGIQNLKFSPHVSIDQSKVNEDVRGLLIRHVADALVQDVANQQRADGMQFIALRDLEGTLASIEKTNNPNSEAHTTLKIEAKGGNAVLEIRKISVSNLQNQISSARTKQVFLCIAALCAGALILNLIDDKKGGLAFLVAIVGLPIGLSLWYGWKEQAEQAQKSIDRYELSRRKVFTKK